MKIVLEHVDLNIHGRLAYKNKGPNSLDMFTHFKVPMVVLQRANKINFVHHGKELRIFKNRECDLRTY